MKRVQVDVGKTPAKAVQAKQLAQQTIAQGVGWKHLITQYTTYKWEEFAPGEWEAISGALIKYWDETCACCKGKGHSAQYCGTKKRMDAKCNKLGMRKLWGSMKYETWFKAIETDADFSKTQISKLKSQISVIKRKRFGSR